VRFYEEKDLALCGLACVLCSQEDCPGCKARGCKEGNDCTVYQCAMGKELDGCYRCDEFPCEENMLQSIRIRAFLRFAKEHGKETLLERLQDNYVNGITYHKPNGLKGDYDELDTEDEIIQLIQYGMRNPYLKCPVYETENFILRLITEEDTDDLFLCYSDVNARPVFNSDTCTSNFFYDNLEDMRHCVKMWIDSYNRKEFIRFSVVDKHSQHAVGTIEMFGMIGKYKTSRGILRLDIASKYENPTYLTELFTVCQNEFFELFAVNQIVTKAVPEAVTRVNVLKRLRFESYDFPEREHYWIFGRLS
jgi:RimJ/RimL family protein N-acetyltransferase